MNTTTTPSRRAFCDLDTTQRMNLREQIERTGAHIDGYSGQFVRVALPNPASAALTALQTAGFHLHNDEISYFPLVSDKPPAHLRHHGRYRDGEPGMWAYVFLWHDSQDVPQ